MQNLSLLKQCLIFQLCQNLYPYFSCVASSLIIGAINVPSSRSITILEKKILVYLILVLFEVAKMKLIQIFNYCLEFSNESNKGE